jgi:hypothetical protein
MSANMGEDLVLGARRIARSPLAPVISIGLVYLALQLLLFSLRRGVSWDEAIYLSQVTPDVPALPFAASRARGITVLVAPIAAVSPSIEAIRLYLAAASSAALAVAFSSWIPHLGSRRALLAAASFGLTWVALLYGSEAMPNLWAGLALTTAVAAFATRPFTRVALLRGAAALAVASFIRPWDALIVGVVVTGWTIATVDARKRLIVLAGAAVGFVPWVVEMAVRSDGPVGAVREAASFGHVTPTDPAAAFHQHLALTDGPILGPLGSLTIPPGGVLWWAGVAGLATVGCLGRGRHVAPVRLAVAAGAAVLASYLLVVDAFAPRFLLPVYALLAPAVAAGVARLWVGASSVGRAGLVVLLVGLASWHLLIADALEERLEASRAVFTEIGGVIERRATPHGCRVISEQGFPQVAFASGCEGRPLEGPDGFGWVLAADRSFVVAAEPRRIDEEATAPLERIALVPAPSGDRWLVFEVGSPGGRSRRSASVGSE